MNLKIVLDEESMGYLTKFAVVVTECHPLLVRRNSEIILVFDDEATADAAQIALSELIGKAAS